MVYISRSCFRSAAQYRRVTISRRNVFFLLFSKFVLMLTTAERNLISPKTKIEKLAAARKDIKLTRPGVWIKEPTI